MIFILNFVGYHFRFPHVTIERWWYENKCKRVPTRNCQGEKPKSLSPHKKSISTNAQYVTQQKYSDIEVLVINFFPTPPLKLKLGLQVGGRLLLATHLNQSNHLPNQKQGAVNQYDSTVFQGSGKLCLLGVPSSSGVTGLDWWTSSKIPSAGSHTEHWWRCSKPELQCSIGIGNTNINKDFYTYTYYVTSHSYKPTLAQKKQKEN